jgi:hypothetical protein
MHVERLATVRLLNLMADRSSRYSSLAHLQCRVLITRETLEKHRLSLGDLQSA